jgi:hypothetical protein
MAILTLVYVVTTIGIALLTLRATNLSKRHLEAAIQIERNRLRPYVVFNVSNSIISRTTYASIKNLGLTAAYNINVSIAPKLNHSLSMESECALTSSNILFLPPSEEITDVLGSSPTFYQTYPNPIFEGTVEYEDIEKNKFKERFHIDLNFLKTRMSIGEATVIDELKKLNVTLMEISKQLKPSEEL